MEHSSPSDQADELEKSEAIYHQHVAGIQLNAQSLKEEIRADNRAEMDLYVDTHLNESAGDILEKFTQILNIDIERVRRDVALLIAQEMDNLRKRNEEILRAHGKQG